MSTFIKKHHKAVTIIGVLVLAIVFVESMLVVVTGAVDHTVVFYLSVIFSALFAVASILAIKVAGEGALSVPAVGFDG